MSTAGRCPCVKPNVQRRSAQYTREKENVPLNPTQLYTKPAVDKSSKVVTQKVVRPIKKIVVPVVRTTQNSGTAIRTYSCGCTTRVPLSDLRSQNIPQVANKRYSEPPRAQPQTQIRTVPARSSTTVAKSASAVKYVPKGPPNASSTFCSSTISNSSSAQKTVNISAISSNSSTLSKTSSVQKSISSSILSSNSRTASIVSVKTNSSCARKSIHSSTLSSNSSTSSNSTINSTSVQRAASATTYVKDSSSSTSRSSNVTVKINSASARKSNNSSTLSSNSSTASNTTVKFNPAYVQRGPNACSTLIANTTWNQSAISSSNQYSETTLISNQTAVPNTRPSASSTLIGNKSLNVSSNRSSFSSRSVANKSTSNASFSIIRPSNETTDWEIIVANKSASSKSIVHRSKASSESTIWETFKTVKSDVTASGPHKRVLRHVPVYNTNVSVQNGAERSVYDGIPSLKKKCLKKQIHEASDFLGVVNLDPYASKVRPYLLYATDILNDIIRNIINQQKDNILCYEFSDEIEHLSEYRATIVNWTAKLHHYLASDSNVFFIAIRLFDKILANFSVKECRYQIIALTTYWISLKYNKSLYFITATNLLKLCNNRYTLDYLLTTEKKILQSLNFNLTVDDPMIFVYYFIFMMQIENKANIISYSANYFLEILALDHNCNCFSLSLQAASALYLSLKLFDFNEKYWIELKKYRGYHDQKEMHDIHKIIFKYLMHIEDDHFPYRESYFKFSSEKYNKVSCKVSRVLENL